MNQKNNPAPINTSVMHALIKRRLAFYELNKLGTPWVFPSKKTGYTTPCTLRHLAATRLRKHTSTGNTSKVLGHSNVVSPYRAQNKSMNFRHKKAELKARLFY